MSNKPVKGLKIGKYRITPLGLATLAVLLLLIVGGVVLAVTDPFSGTDNVKQKAEVTESSDKKSKSSKKSKKSKSSDEEAEDTEGKTKKPTAKPTPSPTPEPEPRSATIRSLGEIAMEQNLLLSAVTDNDFNFDDMFSMVSDIMGNADYTVADVEGTLGATSNYGGATAMITPPSLITTLKNCGVDMLMLANDHALDGGVDQLLATVQNCKDNGMDYVGAAASAEEKATPLIKEINGIKVGFLAYTESVQNTGAAKQASEYALNIIAASNAVKDVTALREAGADVVICYVSWGEVLNRAATNGQKQIARALVNAGVDVIIGYNPHVVQPAAWFETTNAEGNVHRTLCLAATGNFLSDQRSQYADSGIIFQFTIQETEYGVFSITNPVYIPTYVWRSNGENNKFVYRTVSAGQWLEEAPEGMAYADVSRMRQVWAEIKSIMGTEVATEAAQ